MRIRKAQLSDIAYVYEIASRAQATKDGYPQEGFLVKVWRPTQYKSFVTQAGHVLVCEKGCEIVGFVLAFDSPSWRALCPKWESRVKWQQQPPHDYVLIDQVAVQAGHRRQRIGRLLCQTLFHQEPSLQFYSEVLSAPATNAVSLYFHVCMGFKLAAQRWEGTHRWLVLVREPS